MGSEQRSGTAIATFGSAREAERRIAGVAAAARIVREAAAAGLAEAWLVLPDGAMPGAAALDDVRRLAGSMRVRICAGDPAAEPRGTDQRPAVRLPGSRLIAAEGIAKRLAGEADDCESLDLASRRAPGEILRRTGKAGDGPISRRLNRPISRRISALLLRIPGIRPGHATAVTALRALLMFAALVGGGAAGLIAGALLCQAASVFDGVDGELARATFRSSRSGAVLDSAVDVATNVLFFLGLTVNLALRGDGPAVALSAWGFVLFLLGLAAIAWQASRTEGGFSFSSIKQHYRRRFPEPPMHWLIGFFIIVSSRDFFTLLFAVLIVAGLPMAVLYLFAAAATIWFLFVAGTLRLRPKAAFAPRRA